METIVDFLPYSISSLKGIQFFHEIGNIQYVCWFYDFYKQCLRVNFIWQSQLKTLEVELCRTVLSHLKLRIFAEVGLSRLKTCFNDSFVTKYLRFKVKRFPSITLCNQLFSSQRKIVPNDVMTFLLGISNFLIVNQLKLSHIGLQNYWIFPLPFSPVHWSI